MTEQKPMTVGELMEKLGEFDPNEPISIYDWNYDVILEEIEVVRMDIGLVIRYII